MGVLEAESTADDAGQIEEVVGSAEDKGQIGAAAVSESDIMTWVHQAALGRGGMKALPGFSTRVTYPHHVYFGIALPWRECINLMHSSYTLYEPMMS